MKTVRVENGIVREIIPEYALPVEEWYGEAFAAKCVEAPDNVEQRWMYQNGEFSPPTENDQKAIHAEEQLKKLQQENTLLKAQIQAQSDLADFMEGCIAEMEAGKADRADLDGIWEQMASAYREGVQQA